MEQMIPIGLQWKLRRVAADLRQQDVAIAIGISTTRYSGLERGHYLPSELEVRMLEKFLPTLPVMHSPTDAGNVQESADVRLAG